MQRSPSCPRLQDCNPVDSRLPFPFSGNLGEIPGLGWRRKVSGMEIALFLGKYGFSRETALLPTFFEIRDFRNGIFLRFASPRVRRRWEGGPLPPSCPRALPGGCGGVQPLLEFPRRLRVKFFPSSLLPLCSKGKRTWPVGPGPWVRMVAPPRIELGTRGFQLTFNGVSAVFADPFHYVLVGKSGDRLSALYALVAGVYWCLLDKNRTTLSLSLPKPFLPTRFCHIFLKPIQTV